MRKGIFLSLLLFCLSVSNVFSENFIDVVYKVKNNEKSKFGHQYKTADIDDAIMKLSEKKVPKQFSQKKDGYTSLHLLMDIQDSAPTIERLLEKYSKKDKKGCKELVNCIFPKSFRKDGVSFSNLTPLFYAVYKGEPELADVLLRYGADANKISTLENEKMTPLFYAVRSKNTAVLDRLLEIRGIDVDFPVENEAKNETYSPLAQAVFNDDAKTVEKLLRHNANPNYPVSFAYVDEDGIEWKISNGTPVLCAEKSADSLDIVKLLVAYGCDISVGYNKVSSSKRIEGYTPLFKSIDDNDIGFFNLVRSNPKSDYKKQRLAVIDGKYFFEYTPLRYAVGRGEINEAIIDSLVDAERIFEEFSDSRTCGEVILARDDISQKLRNRVEQIDTEVRIFRAIEKCDYNEIHGILESGRNPDVYKGERSALECAVLKALENGGKSDIYKIIRDLMEFGANPNKHKHEKSIFHYVVDLSISSGLDSNKRAILKLLLECGADPSIVVSGGLGNEKPLIPYVSEKISASTNFELLDFFLSDEIQRLEIRHKPPVASAISGGDCNNWTALCVAIKNNNSALVAYLKEKGADINQAIYQDASNIFTPLGLACKQGAKDCVETLLSLGASTSSLQNVYGASKVTVLMVACASMPWSVIERIFALSNNPDCINDVDSLGRNAFMYAAEFNKNPVVAQKTMRNLRGRRAKMDLKTTSGENALSLAINNGQDIRNVLWLLSNGVSFERKVSPEKIEAYESKDFEGYNLLKEINSRL